MGPGQTTFHLSKDNQKMGGETPQSKDHKNHIITGVQMVDP
jgi:hypothetical protein